MLQVGNVFDLRIPAAAAGTAGVAVLRSSAQRLRCKRWRRHNSGAMLVKLMRNAVNHRCRDPQDQVPRDGPVLLQVLLNN